MTWEDVIVNGLAIGFVGGLFYGGFKLIQWVDHQEEVRLQEQTTEVFEELDFDEMVDPEYAIDALVRFEGGVCYGHGWPGMVSSNNDLSVLFEDEASGEAFLAETGWGGTDDHATANTMLAAVNCDESFVVYGKKVLDDQGNPEIDIGTLEFKLGPYRTKRIEFQNRLSPQD